MQQLQLVWTSLRMEKSIKKKTLNYKAINNQDQFKWNRNVIKTKNNILGPIDIFKIRPTPRRAVMGLVVDHELEMTEIRIRQLGNKTAAKLF